MGKITRVGPEFASGLVDLWVSTFHQAYADVHGPENLQAYSSQSFTLQHASDELSDETSRCCVYFRDQTPLGYYLLKNIECPVALVGGSAELKQIYIDVSVYGAGVGQALLDHACAAVVAAGHRWLWLSVSNINDRAQSFYQKNGFAALGEGPVFQVGTELLPSTILARAVSDAG